ncbi:hypothetical protein PMZ80_008616 [Knufia obscura]|uniref:Uncharacterized protein n=1 Tax=Knufia obscura TaxID=1635080 RepID=A0ABR0RFC0_9EURO|nr:hypothetical protein PMZ80_008616 [Knufia obscura]
MTSHSYGKKKNSIYGALILRSEHFEDTAKVLDSCIYIISCKQTGSLAVSRFSSRVYIKIHNPATCKCLAEGKIDVQIQQPCLAEEQNPNKLAKPGANIFASLYFLRPDGTMRNALGQVITVEDKDGVQHAYISGDRTKLGDIVAIGSTGGPGGDTKDEDDMFMKILDWPAEMMDRGSGDEEVQARRTHSYPDLLPPNDTNR